MTARLRPLAEEGRLELGLGPGWRRATVPILAIAALGLANLALGAWLTVPAWRAAAVEGAVERAGQQAQETLEPALVRARRVYGRILTAEEEVAELRARVASRSGSVSEVVSTLRAAIDASGLQNERITYQAARVEALDLTRMQIDLPVRGSYAQLRSFLDTLLDAPIFVIVERVGASTPSSSDTRTGLLLNVALSAFLATGEDAPIAREAPPSTPPAALDGRDPVVLARELRERLEGLPAIPLEDAAFDLDLDTLEAPGAPGAESRRNLFAFANLPPPPQPPGPTPEERERARRERTPPEPVMPYDLLGVIRTADGLLATLSDGRDVYNVVEGDRLPAGMLVKAITLVEVVLEAGRRESTLSLRREDDVPATGRRSDDSDEGSERGAAPARRDTKKRKKR